MVARAAPKKCHCFKRNLWESGCGDALNEVVLLFLRFGADGEGVEHAGAEGIANGFRRAVAQVSLAEDLHADDALALGAHLL